MSRHQITPGNTTVLLLAPFVTAVPIIELWVSAAMPAQEIAADGGGEIVEGGSNVLLLQAGDDTPLAFAREVEGLRLANDFRIYRDLLPDPRRGRERAERFREEVILLSSWRTSASTTRPAARGAFRWTPTK